MPCALASLLTNDNMPGKLRNFVTFENSTTNQARGTDSFVLKLRQSCYKTANLHSLLLKRLLKKLNYKSRRKQDDAQVLYVHIAVHGNQKVRSK